MSTQSFFPVSWWGRMRRPIVTRELIIERFKVRIELTSNDAHNFDGVLIVGRRWVQFAWCMQGHPRIVFMSHRNIDQARAVAFIRTVRANYVQNTITENHVGSAPTEERVNYESRFIRPGRVRHGCIKRMPNGTRTLVRPTVINPEIMTDDEFYRALLCIGFLVTLLEPHLAYVNDYGSFHDWKVGRGFSDTYDRVMGGDIRPDEAETAREWASSQFKRRKAKFRPVPPKQPRASR